MVDEKKLAITSNWPTVISGMRSRLDGSGAPLLVVKVGGFLLVEIVDDQDEEAETDGSHDQDDVHKSLGRKRDPY